MKKVNILIVGTGAIAREHLVGYQQCDNAQVVAACDLNAEKLAEFADEYHIPARYTDFDKALADEKIDAVDICTPNFTHAQYSIKALEANLCVMCEKPMARNAEEAQLMVEAAEKSKGFLMPAFVLRFSVACRVVKDYIDNGYFGDIYYCKARCIRNDGGPGGWSNSKELSGGGALIDVGIHDLDAALYLMGSPKVASVFGTAFQAMGDRRPIKTASRGYRGHQETSDVEDFASGLVRFENGSALYIETSYGINGEASNHSIEIYGTKCGAKLTLPSEVTFFMEQNGFLVDIIPEQITSLKGGNNLFALEMKHFVDCCLNNTECIASEQDGLLTAEIIDAIYESAKSGHEIRF